VVVLPVGSHSLLLVANDGLAAATNAFTVAVITPAEAVRRLMARVQALAPRSHPLLATLSAALASIERGHAVSAANQLRAFQNKVRAQVAPLDAALAATFSQAAQEVVEALNGSSANPSGRQHGRFTSVARQSNGWVELQFAANPGPLYLLEASTNLVDWEMIGVAHDRGNGSFEFEDSNAARSPNRFYRIVAP
jgi:hypothetical protein